MNLSLSLALLQTFLSQADIVSSFTGVSQGKCIACRHRRSDLRASVDPTVATFVSSPSVDKTPSLYDYFLSVAPQLGSADSGLGTGAADRLANAQDKIVVIKDNLSNLINDIDLPDVSNVNIDIGGDGLRTMANNMADISAGLSEVGASSGADIQAFLSSLNLEQNGPWCVAAVAVVAALGQGGGGKEEVRLKSELTEAKRKADEAVKGAALAAEGAARAKDMVSQMDASRTLVGISTETLLETSKLRQMEVETDIMKNDIKKLAEENASLKMKVLSLTQDNASMTESKASPSPSPPDLEVIERDPTEDARILAIIKEVDDKNTKKKSKTKKKRAGVKAGGKTLKKKTKQVTSNISHDSSNPADAKKLTAKSVATKKEVRDIAGSASQNPWSELSDSTLKRKTVAELKEYLLERQVTLTPKMKKADLVAAVKGLS